MYQVGINKGIILRCTAYQISSSGKFLVLYVRVCFGQNEQSVFIFFGAQFLFTLLYENCPQVIAAYLVPWWWRWKSFFILVYLRNANATVTTVAADLQFFKGYLRLLPIYVAVFKSIKTLTWWRQYKSYACIAECGAASVSFTMPVDVCV